jgi:hypothetical protein
VCVCFVSYFLGLMSNEYIIRELLLGAAGPEATLVESHRDEAGPQRLIAEVRRAGRGQAGGDVRGKGNPCGPFGMWWFATHALNTCGEHRRGEEIPYGYASSQRSDLP